MSVTRREDQPGREGRGRVLRRAGEGRAPLPPRLPPPEQRRDAHTLFDVQEMELNFGPAAPVDPRRAPARPQGRRREDPRGEARRRLPPPGHREALRDRDLPDGDPAHRPHGLRRRGDEQPRLLPAVEKLLRRRGPAARPADPRDPRRAAAALLASRVARDLGHRPRRGDALLVRLPRARADPRLLRGVLRRAPDPELHADRRPAVRPDAGLDRARVASSSTTFRRASTTTSSS